MIMRWTCLVLTLLMAALTQGCLTMRAWEDTGETAGFTRVEGLVWDPADAAERKVDYLAVTYTSSGCWPLHSRRHFFRIDCETGQIPEIMNLPLSNREAQAILDSISTETAIAINGLLKADDPLHAAPKSGTGQSVHSFTLNFGEHYFGNQRHGDAKRNVMVVPYWWNQDGSPSQQAPLWHSTADYRYELLDEECRALVLPCTVPKRRMDYCLDISCAVLKTPVAVIADVIFFPLEYYILTHWPG